MVPRFADINCDGMPHTLSHGSYKFRTPVLPLISLPAICLVLSPILIYRLRGFLPTMPRKLNFADFSIWASFEQLKNLYFHLPLDMSAHVSQDTFCVFGSMPVALIWFAFQIEMAFKCLIIFLFPLRVRFTWRLIITIRRNVATSESLKVVGGVTSPEL